MYRVLVVGSIFLKAFFITAFGVAQDSTSIGKWEVGIDLMHFISDENSKISSTSKIQSILLRYQINPNSAFRLRTGFEFYSYKPSENKNYHYSIRPGYERIRTFSSKSSLHYGFELKYDREKLRLFLVDTRNTNNISIQDFPTFSRTLGAGSFIGYRYFILRNLSLYMESGLNYENQKYRVNAINGLIAINGIEVPGGVQITSFEYANASRFLLVPIQLLSISFHF
jgi:hypothetical protein